MLTSLTPDPNLFQFSLNPAAALSFLSALINLYLIYILNYRYNPSRPIKWFTLLVAQGVIWSLFEGLNRASLTPQSAIIWESFSWLGWIFFGPNVLGFIEAFIEEEKTYSKFINQIILFGPSLIVLYLAWTSNLVFDRNLSHWERLSYGQWATHTGLVFNLGVVYVIAVISYGLTKLFRFYLKCKDPRKKLQALILLVGITFPMLGASITNGLFFALYQNQIFRLGSVWIAVGDIMVAYGILKYNLFFVNPATFVNNIVETVNEILLVVNKDHIIEYANKAVEGILGVKKDQLIGQKIENLLDGQWPFFFTTVLDPIEKGKVSSIHSIETELLSSDGQKIPVSFSVSPYKDSNGNITSTIDIVSDIRQLKQLLNVTTERNKLKAMMESISDGVLALDISGKIILVNSAAAHMFNFHHQQLMGKYLNEMIMLMDNGNRYITASDLLPSTMVIDEIVIVRKSEVKAFAKNGKQLYIDLTSSVIKEGTQVGLGSILTFHDISKEKELEAMKLDFVSMAAHELRTPLTVILGYLSIYNKNYASRLDPDQKRFVDRISQASQNLRILIENLLNVTRIERGTFVINLLPLNWTEFVQQTVNSFGEIAKNKQINLEFLKPTYNIPLVYGDKVRLGEVLGNLVDNAIKYTNEKGSVRVWVEIYQGEVVTRVADNGRGIPPEALPYLFTKFFRVSHNLEQASNGTGLGLYISRAIVEKHHGKIWAQSVLGQGSVFSFSLPTNKLTNTVNGLQE